LKENAMRCLVIDDDASDRELVERMVWKSGHQAVTAADGDSAMLLVKNEPFDVALVDLGMPGTGGVQVLRLLRKEFPDLRLLVVSGFDDREHVLDAVGAGADGYVLKSEIPTRLGNALDEVMNGGGPMSAKIAHIVLEELRHPEGTRPGEEPVSKSLSRREWDVLQGLSRGYTYAEIAASLHISVNTVRHHIRNLYGKLDVSGKAEAVTRALSHGNGGFNREGSGGGGSSGSGGSQGN
jgi:DNA-binding NarL/FixJ family response regulator